MALMTMNVHDVNRVKIQDATKHVVASGTPHGPDRVFYTREILIELDDGSSYSVSVFSATRSNLDIAL